LAASGVIWDHWRLLCTECADGQQAVEALEGLGIVQGKRRGRDFAYEALLDILDAGTDVTAWLRSQQVTWSGKINDR